MFGVGHLDLMPFIYGIGIFLTFVAIWNNMMEKSILRRIYLASGFLKHSIPFCIFLLMNMLHGGSMTGGAASTIASLLAWATFPLIARYHQTN